MSEVMKFEITSDEGVLLETAGKACHHDIQVVPKLKSETITKNGTYPVPEGYVGYGDITVDLPRDPIEITENGTYPVPEGSNGYGEIKVNVPYRFKFPMEKVYDNVPRYSEYIIDAREVGAEEIPYLEVGAIAAHHNTYLTAFCTFLPEGYNNMNYPVIRIRVNDLYHYDEYNPIIIFTHRNFQPICKIILNVEA